LINWSEEVSPVRTNEYSSLGNKYGKEESLIYEPALNSTYLWPEHHISQFRRLRRLLQLDRLSRSGDQSHAPFVVQLVTTKRGIKLRKRPILSHWLGIILEVHFKRRPKTLPPWAS
jgi:hypothetical protein